MTDFYKIDFIITIGFVALLETFGHITKKTSADEGGEVFISFLCLCTIAIGVLAAIGKWLLS